MRIGIIGAGQLGQMLGFAARDLGDICKFLDPSPEPPAATAGTVFRAAFDDTDALAELAAKSDVVTYEFENVPVDALKTIVGEVPVYPAPVALEQAQDRLHEKALFSTLDIPLPNYQAVDTLADLRAACSTIGLPVVLKTRRLGYDGKGQYVIQGEADIEPAWQELGCVPLIAEQWVDFDYEVSAIGARNVAGEITFYPLTRNEHSGGILRVSRAPVDEPGLTALAESYMRRLLAELDYVGVLALEMFVQGDALSANEFAPRVHNSGHWTIEGAATSQFANHILAVTGRTLGSTSMLGEACMVNLIGTIPAAARNLEIGHLHDYGKAPRAGRKLGHITAVAASATECEQALATIRAAVA